MLGSFAIGPSATNPVDFTYNGYAYFVSATGATYFKINGDGSSFMTGGTTSTNAPTYNNTSKSQIYSIVAYNGYAYAIGGNRATNQPCDGVLQPACTYTSLTNVQYSKISPTGGLGAWQNATSLAFEHFYGGAAAYNGYLYVYDSYNPDGQHLGETQYVKLNADGTINGSWQTSSTLGSSFVAPADTFATYNGFMYVIGGGGGATVTNTVSFAPLTPSGFGTWQQTTSFPVARAYLTALAYKGYMYITSGCANLNGSSQCTSQTAEINDQEVAPIYANGQLGPWTKTSLINEATGRVLPFMVGYNNYIYIGGGSNLSGSFQDIHYAQISSPGAAGTFTSIGPGLSPGSYYAASVAYGGYYYAIGGCTNFTGQQCNAATNAVQYAAINSDGSVSSTLNTSTLPGNVGWAKAAAYNGYLYVVGGSDGTNNGASVRNTVYYSKIGANGAPGTWQTTSGTSNFTNGRSALGVAVYNGYLYLAGGWDGASNVYGDVQYAPLDPSTGAVGAWQTASHTFSTPRMGLGMVSVAGYLYVMGGCSAATAGSSWTCTYTNDVQVAAIQSNGDLGSWQSAGSGASFDKGRFGMVAAVNNNCAYLMSGFTTTGADGVVQYACVQNDGTLSSWTSTSVGLGRTGVTGTAYSGYLYLATGFDSVMENNMNYAPIENGGAGSTGSWTTSSNQLSVGRINGGNVTLNGYIYSIAGCTKNANSNGDACATNALTTTVEVAKIGASGDVGSWTTTANINIVKTHFYTVAYNGTIYVIAGCSSYDGITHLCSASSNIVQYATPDPATGLISGWTTSSVPFPLSIHTTSPAVATGGYIYVVAGTASYYGQIDSTTHDVVSWTVGTTIAGSNNNNNAALATNGSYLYLIGGQNSGSPNTQSSVEYAPINSDHTIGSWSFTSSMNHPRAAGIFVGVANGYVYAVGGWSDNNGDQSGVEYAPILSSGRLGAWQERPDQLNTPRADASGSNLIYNGYIYVVGGLVSNDLSLRTLEYAPIASIDAIANYSIALTTDKNTNPVNYFLTYTAENAASNITVGYETAAGGSPTWSSLISTTNPGSGSKVPMAISGDGVTYYWLYITIDDTQSAYFGDTPTSISYLQLNYHPNPSMRLRGGQTFNGGSTNTLDAP
jgi:hypothetical protein